MSFYAENTMDGGETIERSKLKKETNIRVEGAL